MAFCTECGNQINHSDRFCSNCGFKISEIEVQSKTSERRKVDLPKSSSAKSTPISAQSDSKIAPIYGLGYKEGVHCRNCGANSGNRRTCNVCKIDL